MLLIIEAYLYLNTIYIYIYDHCNSGPLLMAWMIGKNLLFEIENTNPTIIWLSQKGRQFQRNHCTRRVSRDNRDNNP